MAREAPRHRFLDAPLPIAFAHRGGAGPHPENTLAAFAHAVSLGYRYLETDVHLTVDGAVVAFHDERLDRVTDSSGVIGELPLSAVREARIDDAHGVPLLSELLEAFPRARFNIDAKTDAVAAVLVEVVASFDAFDRVCLASFSHSRIRRMARRAGDQACISMGTSAIARAIASARGVPRAWPDAHCAQVPSGRGPLRIVTERFVETAHANGSQVHVWTVDDPDEMNDLLDMGVDGIMTDEPEVLRDVLTERGEWD